MIEPPPESVVREAAARALGEDRGPADVTSLAVVDPGAKASGRMVAREACRLAGLIVAERVFMEVDPAIRFTRLKQDGDSLVAGEAVMTLAGPARSILTAERSALNFIQQLSGVATATEVFVAAAAPARVLDTRKTVPGLRALQKYAVRCGGGLNHRFGLYDGFMIKDNHVAFMTKPGGFVEAVRRARELDASLKLVGEADTLEQVEAWAAAGVDQVLLDNMDAATMAEAVRRVGGRCRTEASGTMTPERAREAAAAGVDFVSVGAITHSARAIDFSLELMPG
ncbi:MAG: carboxylating nicotinate-nucleotide diphosphorylase [Candidatus Methylacidiphilales bacterium]